MDNFLFLAMLVGPLIIAALLAFWSRRVSRPRKTVLRVFAAVSGMIPFVLLGLLFWVMA